MIKNKGKFIIKFKKQDEEFVENLNLDKLMEGYDKAKNFFEYNQDISPIRICLIYSPEEYLFFSGYSNYEPWMRACTGYHNTIYIFAPSVVEKYTIHKKDDIFKVLIHEITHLFYGYSSMKKNLAKFPLWEEGIAKYISNQKATNQTNFNLCTLKNFEGEYSKNYNLGYRLIECIMDHFKVNGNKKIIEFLIIANYSDSEEELFKKFKEVFGIEANILIQLKGGIIK